MDFLRLSLVAFVVCIFPPTEVLGALRCDDHCASGCTKYGAGHCDLYCKPRATWRLRIFDHTCQPRCGGHCLYCRSLYYCDVCWQGYQLVVPVGTNQRLCKMLPPVCDVNCLDPKNCQLNGECNGPCKTGYSLVSKKCIPVCDAYCVAGATACDTYGPKHCDDTCVANYILLTSIHVCQGCDPYCTPTTPGSCSGAGTCDTSCVTGYALNAGTSSCDKCLSTCTACTDTSGCSTCGPNTVNNPPTCPACDANCQSGCVTAGYCDATSPPTCAPGFGFTSTTPKKCGSCDTYCDTTTPTGCNTQGAGRCDTACIQGYILDAGTHTCAACQVPNPANCMACTTAGTCTTCVSGTPDATGYCA